MIQLRNKKSGKIATLVVDGALKYVQAFAVEDNSMERLGEYKTLAELNTEWEDVPEEKHYFIDNAGNVKDEKGHSRYRKQRQEIGNDFETKEETEKAVEKLKAITRLKDKGADFYGWRRNQTGTYELYLRWKDRIPRSYEVKNDLDLLFPGGEND